MGEGHVRQTCGSGHVLGSGSPSTGHLPHEEPSRRSKDDIGWTLKRPRGHLSSYPNLGQRRMEVRTPWQGPAAYSQPTRAQTVTETTDLGQSKCYWLTCMALKTLCSAPPWHPEAHPQSPALRGPQAPNKVQAQLPRLARRDGAPQRLYPRDKH